MRTLVSSYPFVVIVRLIFVSAFPFYNEDKFAVWLALENSSPSFRVFTASVKVVLLIHFFLSVHSRLP